MTGQLKENYQLKMEKIIEGLSHKPSLLLHSCCGPCSSYVLDYLKDFFDITVLYYNPNIFPEAEYQKRLEVQKSLIEKMNKELMKKTELAVDKDCKKTEKPFDKEIKLMTCIYDHEEFLNVVHGLENEPEGGKRCEQCFKLRLSKTMQIATEKGFEYFGTTLSVSPHKNATILNQIGKALEGGTLVYDKSAMIFEEADSKLSENKVKWLYADFKKKEGYKKSIELSKKYNLYRQDYCGCEFANKE